MRGPTSWGDGESWPGGGGCLKTELLQCIATLPGGSGQWNLCNATLPGGQGVCLSAWGQWVVGSGSPVMHRHTAQGQWAVQLM